MNSPLMHFIHPPIHKQRYLPFLFFSAVWAEAMCDGAESAAPVEFSFKILSERGMWSTLCNCKGMSPINEFVSEQLLVDIVMGNLL